MIGKLACKNIWSHKQYYGLFILQLTFFFLALYSLAVFAQFGKLMQGLVANEMYGIPIVKLQTALQWIQVIQVVVLVAYIGNFLQKRRSLEIGLYKLLGLSSRKIFQIFMLEQLLVSGIAIALSFGLSRFVHTAITRFVIEYAPIKIESSLIAFHMEAFGFPLIVSAVLFGICCLLIVLHVPRKSIKALFVSHIEPSMSAKLPWISIGFLTYSIASLLILFFTPVGRFIANQYPMAYMLAVLFSAMMTVWSLYHSGLVLVLLFIKHFRLHYSSTITLLASKHAATTTRKLSKLLSVITIISALSGVICAALIGVELDSIPSVIPFTIYSQNSTTLQDASKSILSSTTQKQSVEALIFNVPLGQGQREQTVLFVSQKAFVTNLLTYARHDQNAQFIEGLEESNIMGEQEFMPSAPYVESANQAAIDSGIQQMFGLVPKPFFQKNAAFYFPLDTRYRSGNESNKIAETLLHSQIFVVSDTTFMTLKQDVRNTGTIYGEHALLRLEDMTFGALEQLYTIDATSDVLSDSATIMGFTQRFLYIVMIKLNAFLLLASLFVSLLLAIFFRNIELLEGGRIEYQIAMKVGMRRSKVVKSLAIELFTTQVLPFALGIIGGLGLFVLMLNQLIGSEPLGEIIQTYYNDTLFQVMLISSAVILLVYIMLIFDGYQQIVKKRGNDSM